MFLSIQKLATLCAIKNISIYQAFNLSLEETVEIFITFFSVTYTEHRAAEKLLEWGIPHHYCYDDDDGQSWCDSTGYDFDGTAKTTFDMSHNWN
jgi:hypothetical protein